MQKFVRKALLSTVVLLLMLVGLASVLLSGIHYLLLGLVSFLQPLTGLAGAYAITGALCLSVLLIFALGLKRGFTPAPQVENTGVSHKISLRDGYRVIQKYPIEAASLAFVAGYSAEDEQFRRLLIATTYEFIREESGS